MLIPGKGKGKLTSALSIGGPDLVMATINEMTRKYPALQAKNWIITGFAGFQNIVNDIGGVNVLIDPQMNDPVSGAQFAKGWHAMNGAAALAFTRNRKGLASGDFGRSLNQGRFLIYTLAKLREETSDVTGLVKWINSFRKNGRTNMKVGDMLASLQILRSVDPTNVANVVVKGKASKVKGQAVVLLNDADPIGLFNDVSRDAIPDGK